LPAHVGDDADADDAILGKGGGDGRHRRREQRHAEREQECGWRSLDRSHKLSRKILN
jgi:hypothetical protein